MDDDEVIRFEITDQDLEDEMNTSYGRPRMSKNQATYGIWADNSDSEGEGDSGPGLGGRSKKRDFTAPVQFVSGGVVGEKKEATEEDNEVDSGGSSGDEGGDEDSGARSAQSSGGGSGFGYRSAAGRVESEGQIAGMRSQGYKQSQSLGKGLGDWEKHTKGIGAKMLLQMGFQPGKGLGKNLHGRTQIVEAHVRKKGAGVGAAGPEGGRPKKEKGQAADSEEEEEKEFKDKLNQWRVGSSVGAKKKNVSYVYKSVDEVLQEGQFRKVDRGKGNMEGVKVIDMTGREERVLTGYSSIAGQQRPSEEDGDMCAPLAGLRQKKRANFELPELMHNLNLLVDMCEQDIIADDRKLIYHRDRISVLEREGEKLSKQVEKDKHQINAMEQIIEVLDKLEEKHTSGDLDQDLAMRAFTQLKEEFGNEFHEFELAYCAQTIVIPLVKKSLDGWNPLSGHNESLPHLTTFTQWKEVLDQPGDQSDHQPGPGCPTPPYHSLVWETWVPLIRLAVQRWHSRNPEPLVRLLDLWRSLVPGWILSHVLDQLVMVRLKAEVEVWDPLTDTTPIHTWLHPWLPPLGSRLEILFPTIRNKLAAALSSWHPTDRSAKLILLPWKDVFSPASMNSFLTKNIVPKLATMLASLPINPNNQDLSHWHSFTDWSGLIPPPQLANILAQSFLPRWLQVLAGWLNSTPNYEEVVGWYQGWKSVIPPSVLPLPGVADQLSQALHMMNRSVSGGGPLSNQPGALENVRYMTSREFQQTDTKSRPYQPPLPGTDIGNTNKMEMSEAVKTSAQIPQGFKDLVARRCEERGIIFRPLPGKFREGKQVYLCGNRHTYLDRNVVFVMDGTVWVPTSLNSLLDGALKM